MTPLAHETCLWPLDHPEASVAARAGGKGAALARAAAAGLEVPATRIVPADALRTALRAAGLARDAATVTRGTAAGLRAAVRDLPLPAGWADTWVGAARALGGTVAVRSSAVDEDGRHRSFAGVHDSVVGVLPEQVPDAVRQVWASLWSDAAWAYRGGPPGPAGMAVVIQAVVHGDVAGVAFTIDPRTGRWSHALVEAVRGAGAGLVDGRVAPTSAVVRRPSSGPRMLRRPATVVERSGEDRVLDDALACAVVDLALRCEPIVGGPADVEWARAGDRVVILQARPITALPAVRAGAPTLWTRRFLGERWHGPATPMGWSVVEPALSARIAYPETQRRLFGGGPALRLVDGYPYVDATVFRHLLFKLPGAPPPRFMLELLPPDEVAAWRSRRAAAPDLRVLASLLAETVRERRWTRFAWDPLSNPRRWRLFADRLRRELPGLGRPPVSDRDAARRVGAHLQLVSDYVGIHVASLLHANLDWQLLESALQAALPDQAATLLPDLVRCPEANQTVQVDQALWSLAQCATDDDLDRLTAGAPLRPAFGDALALFLRTHGHRSTSSWEVFASRWSTHPHTLAPLLRARRADPVDPRTRSAAAAARADSARLALNDAPAAWRPVLLGLLWYTRRFLLLRENQRYAFDRLQDSLARALREVGARLVRHGAIAHADDVAFLTWPEARATLSHPRDLRDAITTRRRDHARQAAITPPTTLSDAPEVPLDARRLQGQPLSAGRATGRVRVVRTLHDGGALAPDDVLVAVALDPAWTPLLATARAAVVELGGALSHAAVIAREYQVPMVGDLANATQVLRDGDEVTVDGSTGRVWMHRSDSGSSPPVPDPT